MSWDEWQQLKADVAAQQSTAMRLDQLAPAAGGGGAGTPDLASSPDQGREGTRGDVSRGEEKNR